MNLWILSRLSDMVQSCDQHFKSYDLHFATQSLYNFWVLDFCDIYLVSKTNMIRSLTLIPPIFFLICLLHIYTSALSD